MEWLLDRLKRRGLLQDVDLASRRVSMHDLYREFAELVVRGKLDALQTLDLVDVYDLRTLSGLAARWASGLKSLKDVTCWNLGDIPGLEQLTGLEKLEFVSCQSMAHLQLDLQKLTKLRALEIRGELFSSLCLPRQLQQLNLGPSAFSSTDAQDEAVRLKVTEALKVNRQERLQVLDLSGSDISNFPTMLMLNVLC